MNVNHFFFNLYDTLLSQMKLFMHSLVCFLSQTELIRWFGGRITNGAMSVDVGVPYLKKEELKWKRLKKVIQIVRSCNQRSSVQ